MSAVMDATWRGEEFVAANGEIIATYAAGTGNSTGVLVVGESENITISHTAGAVRWQVTGDRGEEAFSIRTHGFGVGTLTARCGQRRYRLERAGLLSKKRHISDAEGAVIAETAPRGLGDLAVSMNVAPTADIAFMSWALTLIDTPVRQTRI